LEIRRRRQEPDKATKTILARISIFINKVLLLSLIPKIPADPDDLGRPLRKRAVSQVRPSSIVDATTPAALLTVAAEAVSFGRLRNGRGRADIGSRFGEVRDVVLRWLMARVVRGGAKCGKGEQGNCQSKHEGRWVLD
jgi:hypothetical protein